MPKFTKNRNIITAVEYKFRRNSTAVKYKFLIINEKIRFFAKMKHY